MGAIDLAKSVVTEETESGFLDLMTRNHLYKKGLDYRHGTGHGIGAYLKVHEGPILVRMSPGGGELRENMFFSDEPGFYKDGQYGIRLETILRVVGKVFSEENFGQFIGFEAVTLVPFEPKLIDFSLMSPEQIEWLNEYNELIHQKVSPYFVDEGREDVVHWIEEKTARIDPGLSAAVQSYKNDL